MGTFFLAACYLLESKSETRLQVQKFYWEMGSNCLGFWFPPMKTFQVLPNSPENMVAETKQGQDYIFSIFIVLTAIISWLSLQGACSFNHFHG